MAEDEKIFYRGSAEDFTELTRYGFVAHERYMDIMRDLNFYFGEAPIIEKINKNADEYFDFSKSLVDIGSEIGVYSQWTNFSYFYMFEGNRRRVIMSDFNMLLRGKADNFESHNVLLSDGHEQVHYDGFLTEFSPVADETYCKETERKVPSMCLDDFDIRNVGLIKMDVEGMEEKVIRGGIGTIVRNNYPPILFELWPVGAHLMTQEQRDKTENLLRSLGYDILWEWGDFETHLAIKR